MAMSELGRRAFFHGGVATVAAATGINWALKEDIPVVVAAEDTTGLIVIADASNFPGIDPSGGADSTAGIQAAIDQCVDGGLLIIPGGLYLISAPISPKNGKSLRIRGYGATLVATSEKSVISLRGEYDPVFAVSQVESALVKFESGASETTSVLTMATPPPWSAGDIIKVVSDDGIEGARNDRCRRGEFATVLRVETTRITIAGRLREVYSQNVRAARISRQSIGVEGLQFLASDDRLGEVNEALLSFSRLYNPSILNVQILRAGGHAMRFSSCYGYRVENVDVSYARDAPSASVLGYGVLDNSCSFGRVIGGTYRHVRHAYTDDTPSIAPNDADLAPYGRTYGTIVSGVHVTGVTAAGFSTHHSSEGGVFDACVVTAGAPVGSSAVGFELRGKAHSVQGCAAVGLTNGVLIRTESGGGESWGHTVTDFRAQGMTNAAIRVEIHPAGHPAGRARDSKFTARIDGVRSVESLRLLYAENARLSISNGHYLAPPGRDGDLLEGFFVRNSDISVRNTIIDYSENIAGRPRPFITGSSAGTTPGGQETTIDGLEIRIEPSASSRAYFAFGGAENRIYGTGIRFTHPFPRTPGESHIGTSWQWTVDRRPEVPNSDISSRYYSLKSTALPATFSEILKSDDPEVIIHVNTEGKRLQVDQLPVGRRKGQRWIFLQTSSGELTFVNGASARTSLKSGANRILWKGRRLELVWDGELWHEPVSL